MWDCGTVGPLLLQEDLKPQQEDLKPQQDASHFLLISRRFYTLVSGSIPEIKLKRHSLKILLNVMLMLNKLKELDIIME